MGRSNQPPPVPGGGAAPAASASKAAAMDCCTNSLRVFMRSLFCWKWAARYPCLVLDRNILDSRFQLVYTWLPALPLCTCNHRGARTLACHVETNLDACAWTGP